MFGIFTENSWFLNPYLRRWDYFLKSQQYQIGKTTQEASICPVALEHPRKSSRLFLGVIKGLLRVYWGF